MGLLGLLFSDKIILTFEQNVQSEYNAPDDFVCVWEKNAVSTFGANGETGDTKHSTERLFVYGG